MHESRPELDRILEDITERIETYPRGKFPSTKDLEILQRPSIHTPKGITMVEAIRRIREQKKRTSTGIQIINLNNSNYD